MKKVILMSSAVSIVVAVTLLATVDHPAASGPSCPCPAPAVVPTVDPVVPADPDKLTLTLTTDTETVPGVAFIKAAGQFDKARIRWGSDTPHDLRDESTVLVFLATKGEHIFWVAYNDLDESDLRRHVVSIGPPIPPTPVPVPPEPVPPTPGPLVVSIIYETSEVTPAMAATFLNLRTGTAAAYLKGKGHALNVLDDDLTDATGKPSALVQRWAPIGKIPELVIGTPQAKVIWRGPLPATADAVIEQIKKVGG